MPVLTSKHTIDRSHSLAAWLKAHYRQTWWVILLLACFPAIELSIGLYRDTLGVNPLQTLQQQTGYWSMLFLLITLTITPLRRITARLCQRTHALYGKRLSDWNWIIRLRRMLGLICFMYACLHLAVWVHFDIGYDWQWAREDIAEKPYLGFGLAAFLTLIPLAATSTQWAMAKLGRNWRRLHQSVYLTSIIVIIHQWIALKPGTGTPWLYAVILGALLGYRLLNRFGWLIKTSRDNGMEVAERPPLTTPTAANVSQSASPTPDTAS